MTKVFISYSHKDRHYVRHLDSQFQVLVDVFWDWNLRAGNWRNQLATEIETCDFFLVIMSLEHTNSPMCQWEVQEALNHLSESQIIPIYLSTSYHDEHLKKLGLQYADFSRTFDEGFRILTWLILKERISPWETLRKERDYNILHENIEKGFVPTLILREWADWMIVDLLWSHIEEKILQEYEHELPFEVLQPITPYGLLDSLESVYPHFTRNPLALQYTVDASKIAGEYLTRDETLSEDARIEVGLNTLELADKLARFLNDSSVAGRNSKQGQSYRLFYKPNIIDKLRQLITYHARRLK